MKKITVKSLLNEDKKLITESTYDSIKNNGRMKTNIRQAVERQLNCYFDIVTYVSGKKGSPSHFLVDKEKRYPDKYKAHGRNSVILQEDLNAIVNFIGKQQPTKMIADGKKEVENSFTLKEIFQRSFKLRNIDLSVRNSYVENFYNLEGLEFADEHLDNEIRRQIDCDYLIDYYNNWFKSLAKQYVEKTLAHFSIDYSISYHSFSEFTYDDEGKVEKKRPTYNKISEEEFYSFKEERKAYRQSLTEEMTNKEKDNKVNNEMEKRFQYSHVFEKYIFYDNSELLNEDFDILECNQRLEKRLIKLAKENQNRYEADGEPSEVEYVTYRLKKFLEYALFCEKFYNKLFKLNGHDSSNEDYYNSDTSIKNKVCLLIKEYCEKKEIHQEKEKEKIIKKVHLSTHNKEIFDNKEINDMYILCNVELFARIVESHYEHTEKSYAAYKETSCKKIKELGKQKLDKLPKEIRKQLELRYLENQKEPGWIEFLEAENLKEENSEKRYTIDEKNNDSENYEDAPKIYYELYDRKKEVEEKRKEEEFFEDLQGGNNYKSKLKELGIEDTEVYNFPKLFEALTVIDKNVPFTKVAYRKYRETNDLILKELAQIKIDAITKTEEGRCRMEEFKVEYEYEEEESIRELMDDIYLELKHQVDENYSLEMKLSIVDTVLEGYRKYLRTEVFNCLKIETDELKKVYIALENEAMVV
ncbi:hypothetical protein JZO72_01805 [Vagococcus fluvialis]|uniref:hypothetical protein n=1 Tax=Vagococcus fluvialis TaxID=2738 RepID=UPI001A8F8289|nr:hypothetical protein [Vagococcus fluvialis]MBO0478352.1 hypothetical protein [Vagococcus fluvialis]MBO0484747.1 hypothetical protein [Vagococcus fluvialis]